MPELAEVTIGVMGSGTDEHDALASEVGVLLAELEVNLLTGAGGGVMRSVSRAFTHAPRRRGICIGIVPCDKNDRAAAKDGYPNEFIELAIRTHLPYSRTHDLSRNHINVLTSRAVIALPGGEGTEGEVELAVRYGRAVMAYGAQYPGVKRAANVAELRSFLLPYALPS